MLWSILACTKPNPEFVGGDGGSEADAEPDGEAGGDSESEREPLVCLDGTECVADNELCLVTQEGGFDCVKAADCPEAHRCETECCALGSQCQEFHCGIPDLAVEIEWPTQALQTRHFETDACEVQEACIGDSGTRMLLTFTRIVKNVGEGDFTLGRPADLEGEFTEFDECHDHWHLPGFSSYQLIDENGDTVASTALRDSCLRDAVNVSSGAAAWYACSSEGEVTQGIQAGWADTREAGASCQWIDVTGVAPGDYTLKVSINDETIFVDSDSTNNTAVAGVTIPTTCPLGCSMWSSVCCRESNPCEWGPIATQDGWCDCDGGYDWEIPDCANCSCWGEIE